VQEYGKPSLKKWNTDDTDENGFRRLFSHFAKTAFEKLVTRPVSYHWR